ncbi:hypothetical protein [Wenyingzhuangia sp. IMCC45574]
MISTVSFAQTDISVATLSGYQSNILKMPDQFVNDEDELLNSDELYSSSFYQDVRLKLKYKHLKKKTAFKAYFIPENRFYFSEPDLNRLSIDTKLDYDYTLKKNLKWENELQYKIINQEGSDADNNELNTPFGYKQLTLNSGLRFRLYKNNRSFVELSYSKKDFDATETRELTYHKYGIATTFKNIKWKHHLLHSYGTTAAFYHRDYDILNFSDDEEDEEAEDITSSRIWQYLNLGAFYELPINKQWRITPQLEYENRMDQTNNRFGYSQFRPSVSVEYKSKRMKLNLKTSYANRKFSNLNATNQENKTVGKLVYNYLYVKFLASYKLNKKLSLIANTSFTNRISNNAILTTQAYRSYQRGYAGIGINYTF